MSANTYSVVVDGRTLAGQETESVARNLAELFKRQPEQMQALLLGKSTTIRKGLDEATAKRYQTEIERAGASCHIVSESMVLEMDDVESATSIPYPQKMASVADELAGKKEGVAAEQQKAEALLATSPVVADGTFHWPALLFGWLWYCWKNMWSAGFGYFLWGGVGALLVAAFLTATGSSRWFIAMYWVVFFVFLGFRAKPDLQAFVTRGDKKRRLLVSGLVALLIAAFVPQLGDEMEGPMLGALLSPESTKAPPKDFMDSELMARAGISELGISVEAFMDILTALKQTNGESLKIVRWERQREENMYVATLQGMMNVRLVFEQYLNVPSHPVLLREVEVNGGQVPALAYVMTIVAAVSSQPEAMAALKKKRSEDPKNTKPVSPSSATQSSAPTQSGSMAFSVVKVEDNKRFGTRHGKLEVNEKDGVLTMNGERVMVDGKNLESDYIVAAYRLGETDVVLVSVYGGTLCPALHRAVTSKATGWAISQEFGTCSDHITAKQDGKSIVFEMPGFVGSHGSDEERKRAGQTRVRYVYENDKVVEQK